MPGGILGSLLGGTHLLDGVTKGIQKGLEYDVDFFKALAHAGQKSLHGDSAELSALIDVASTFVKEATDEAGHVKDLGKQILTGDLDPFAGSRHKLQKVLSDYKEAHPV